MATYDIPEVGEQYPDYLLDATHSDYDDAIDDYKFWRHSDMLTGGYASIGKYEMHTTSETAYEDTNSYDYGYLIRGSHEDLADYNRRRKEAVPPPFVREGIAAITGVLASQPVERQNYPDKIKETFNSATLDGNPWKTFLANEVIPLMERYGWVGVLPTFQNNRLYYSVVNPEHIDMWGYDESGEYEWMRFKRNEEKETSPYELLTRVNRYYYISKLGFWVVEQDISGGHGIVTESNYWNRQKSSLTKNPLVIWELPDRMSPTELSAGYQYEYYNTESRLVSIQYLTAFPQLTIPSMNPDNESKLVKRGAGRVMYYNPESGKPELMSPDTGAYDALQGLLANQLILALRPYGINPPSSRSGVALAHVQFTSSNIYRTHANACQQGEYRTLAVTAEMLGIQLSSDTRVEWPAELTTLGNTIVMENLKSFMDMNPGDYGEELTIMRAANQSIPGITDKEKDKLRESIQDRQERDTRDIARYGDDNTPGSYVTNSIKENINPVEVQGTLEGNGT
jgi:hypothetical protein